MTSATCVKRNGALLPNSEESDQLFSSIKDGAEVRIEIKARRNVRRHRLLFAILNVVVKHDVFPSTDVALDCLKIASGHVEFRVEPSTGQTYMKPKSIAFESMEEAAFGRWLDRAIYLVTERWLVGTDADALRNEVYEIVDGPERSALGRRAA